MSLSDKYRQKALDSEQLAETATDTETRDCWNEIAVEWHALASRAAAAHEDGELEFG